MVPKTVDRSDLARQLVELGSQVLRLALDINGKEIVEVSSFDLRSHFDGISAFNFIEQRPEPTALAATLTTDTVDKRPLPDHKLVRQILRQRRLRVEFFGNSLFADPAWDILLDLTAARTEGKRVSITSLCIAANVPATTALRWIQQMTESGLLQRTDDDQDRRRAFVSLSDKGANLVANYFWQAESDYKSGR